MTPISILLWIGRLALVGAALPLVGGAQEPAISLSEVIELRQQGVASQQILRIAQRYCVTFTVGDSVERALVVAGVDADLVEGLRRTCIVEPPRPLPPGVLHDDTFTEQIPILRQDERCSGAVDGAGLRLASRSDATGCALRYQAWEHVGGAVRIELTFKDLLGEPQGVMVLGLGATPGSWDQFTISVSSRGEAELGRTSAGRFRRLALEHRNVSLRTRRGDENHLVVELRGRSLTVAVNDVRVLDTVLDREPRGEISLGLGGNSEVRFTRLMIREAGRRAAFR